MALTPIEKEEIHRIGVELEGQKSELIGYHEAMQLLSKAVDRLSIVVVGDDELKVTGLNKRLEQTEDAHWKLEKKVEARWQKDDIQRTKIVWFVIGAAAVMNAAFRLVVFLLGLMGVHV